MSVECTGRNVEVTDAVRELARKRTQRLERHLGGPANVRVVLSHEKHRFGAEIIATHRRRQWKAQEETADPEASVARAFEKIHTQARKDSEKRRDGKHRGAFAPVGETARAAGDTARPGLRAGSAPRIIRVEQRLPVKPMSVEEAALWIVNSRQEFLVFRDSGSERVSVLYKRRDGDLGLIVPEC
ncbi:MAG: ribosome hibernation-promoting factor, HPF/YfiA family [Thermoanaerobaculia bacterium]